nr:hypothetical protein [Rubrivivax sp.]
AQTLGLQVKSVDSAGGEVVQNLQPLHPFWMRISVREELGEVVAVRRHDGGWDGPHPWLQRTGPSTFGYGTPDPGHGAQSHDAEAPQPYFQTAGATRVGVQEAVAPQRLREQQQLALRASLAGSLQGLTEALAASPDDEIQALQQALSERQAALLAEARQQAGAGSLVSWADAQPVPALLALECALMQAGLSGSPVDPGQRRLTHAEARQAIEGLDEVQLVLESILGAEWEHWGNPRWNRGLPTRPEPCVPAHSLQGGFEALQDCAPPSVNSSQDGLKMAHYSDGSQDWVHLMR